MKKASRIYRICERLGLLDENVSLRRRIGKFFILFLLCPVVIITSLFMVMAIRILDAEMAQLMLRSLTQTAYHVEAQLSNAAEITQGILLASYPYINSSDSLKQQIEDISAMNNIIDGYENRNMIAKIRMYVIGPKLYSHQRDRFYPMSDLAETDIAAFQESLDEGRSVLWLETYAREAGINQESMPVISCVSLLRSVENYDRLACALYADIPVKALAEMMTVGFDKGETVYLTSPKGVVLAHNEPELIATQAFDDEQMALINDKRSGTFYRMGESGRELIAYTCLSYPDWILINRVDASAAYQKSLSFYYMGGILLFLLMLVLMVFASVILFSSVLEATIRRIGNTVQRLTAEKLDLWAAAPSVRRDDGPLSALESNTDQLISSIRTLVEEAYRDRLRQREAQLRALQAQINPHFLYNTLDMIKWMVMDADRDTGVSMINSLSRYFRRSLNAGRDIVPLRDEVELVQAYLDIQERRFSNGFAVRWSVDEQALDCRIPKLTFQPFVENALLHGLYDRMNGSGVIAISISRCEDEIRAEILDNGVGMDAQTLAHAMREGDGHGFGISNVDERIRLLCGSEYGVSVQSELGSGTRVTIRLRSIPQRQA